MENHLLCIPAKWVCGRLPMSLNFDTEMCSAPYEHPECREYQFQCHLEEKKCLSRNQLCNNVTDCIGQEDELFCSDIGRESFRSQKFRHLGQIMVDIYTFKIFALSHFFRRICWKSTYLCLCI